MKIDLEEMDWLNVEIKCKEILREAQMSTIQANFMMEKAKEELKKFKGQQKQGIKGDC